MRLVWSGGRGRGGREVGMFESPELAWLAGGICKGIFGRKKQLLTMSEFQTFQMGTLCGSYS